MADGFARHSLITGGMGGLGETISTKMTDAGHKVAVTFSPSNKTPNTWLAAKKKATRSPPYLVM